MITELQDKGLTLLLLEILTYNYIRVLKYLHSEAEQSK